MFKHKEYSAPTVGQNACTYSMLQNTYSGASADGRMPVQNTYVVPKLCPNGPGPNYPPKYDALTHGVDKQCGGYFNILHAYPYADCERCNAPYVTRPCDGNISCGNTVEQYYHK